MRVQSGMPVTADAAEAVIAGAGETVARAARKQERKAVAEGMQRRKQQDRAAQAAKQAGRRRAEERRPRARLR